MIIKIFLMSLFCVGVYKASEPEMILEPVRNLIYKIVTNEYLRKPLFGCVYCMASIWGTIAYILLYLLGYGYSPAGHLLCCVCCVAMNGIIVNLLPE